MDGSARRPDRGRHYEAALAAKLLTLAANQAVDVTGVVVVVAPKSMTVRESPSGAAVVTDTQVLRWLNNRPTVLTPGQAALVTAAAVRPGTWHRNPMSGADAAVLQHEFTALRTLVDRARRRRAGWILALLIMAPVVLANLQRFF